VQWVPGLGTFNDTYLGRLFFFNTAGNTPVPGVAFNGEPSSTTKRSYDICSHVSKTLLTAGGSGAASPAFVDAPLDAIQRQARLDDGMVVWDVINQDPSVNPASDVCLVFVNELALKG
jgi:hypothetical protein